ncbi:hypothetical protein Anas_03528 [Armadillidium nasatum]|uniref:Uncharacterized protein n=1 Tax=Armadillidium nasatum TaxID=96803 RepID=A0A5N5SWW2_9CRUS|nr:hypothetical protein Anas_03528 [Armadillidium nasatum]
MNRTKYSAPVKQTDQKSLYSYNSTEDDSSTYNFEINEARVYLFYMISDPFLKFWGWICIPVFLIVFATGLTKLVAPQAAGSICSYL